MAKDPAFLFYPGDYLRDTQCLSEEAQVAYDRIMCEHMRNICISQQQLDFFTKRLTPDQKLEVEMVLTEVDGGYQITWVAESIAKRRDYSESRRQNRSKPKKTSSSYDPHMENENENAIVNEIKDSIKKESVQKNVSREPKEVIDFTQPDIEGDDLVFPIDTKPIRDLWANWKKYRWVQYRARYGMMGEQADLKRFEGMNYNQIESTILTAMANNWKNLYPEQNKNGTSKTTTRTDATIARREAFARRHGTSTGG